MSEGTTTYSIENAKSGRAKCKKCKEKIEKGEIRIGVSVPGPDFNMQSWYHPICWNLPRKLVKEGITATDVVNDMMEDNTNDNILQDEEEKNKIIAAIESKVKKAKATDDGMEVGDSKIEEIKKHIAERDGGDDDDDDKPKKKKAKFTDEEKGEMDMYSQYSSMNNEELKNILRRNKQQVSGTKELLMVRCIDGQLRGRLALCPQCDKGKLVIKSASGEEATCNGYFDEDMGARIPCVFRCPIGEAPRFQPWYTEELSEEEQAQMDAQYDQNKNAVGASGGLGDDQVALLTKKAVDTIGDDNWNLDSTAGVKAATSSIVEVCLSTLDIPDDAKKARMAVGKIITSNRESSIAEIILECVDKFGFISAKIEKAKVKSEAASKQCAHPANVPVYEAMLELKELYFKGGNRNAGVSYDKVANAIRQLDFEITEENAMGLGQGKKTKVEGIGKGSATKILEFVQTGTMQKLEEKRAEAE